MSTVSTSVPRVDADVHLEVLSHGIKVHRFNLRGREALLDYCRGLAAYGIKRVPGGRFVKAMLRVFVGVTSDRSQFNFHIHQLEELLHHLKLWGFTAERISITYPPRPPAADVEFTLIDHRAPRDYQEPIIDYLAADGYTKVVTVDPGRGKTFMTLQAMLRLKKRTMFVIKAMYVKKWIDDSKEAFDLSTKDIMVIRGGHHLKTLTQLASEGKLEAKIIICSNMTFFNYLKDYEKFKDGILDLGYACTPEDLYGTLGVGLRVIDEVHQDFHLNFRQDLYSNVDKTISLSGTLDSDDPFMNRMYEVMFPKSLRIDNGARHVYVAAKGLEYRFKRQNLIKYTNKARGSYSHVVFEQSLMKHPECLQRYLEMIATITQRVFVSKREAGQKMLIYAATVELCTILSKHLARLNPVLDVQRYVSEDDYDEMLEADLIVSTLKSLGTAVDVPGLRIVLMTDALGSKQANLQAMGRLRPMKDFPEITPEFYYLINLDIPKHLEYHQRKMENFKGRVVGHQSLGTEFAV